MAGTKTGAAKASKTNKERHGENFYCLIGSTGGKKKSPTKGFGYSVDRAKNSGKKGGARSFKGLKLIKKNGEIYTYENKKTGELITINYGQPQKILARFRNFVSEVL